MKAFPLRGRWVRKHSDEVENITLFLKATPHQSVKLTASPQGEALQFTFIQTFASANISLRKQYHCVSNITAVRQYNCVSNITAVRQIHLSQSERLYAIVLH